MNRRGALFATAGLALSATRCAEQPAVAPAKAPPPIGTIGIDVARLPPPPPPEPPKPPAPSEPPKPKLERVVARVGRNHGHVFEVTMAEVLAGETRTYELKGTAGHSHQVTLDAAAFSAVRDGGIVRLPSTRFGHLHRLLVRLAPSVDPPEAANQCDIEIAGKDDHEFAITASDLALKIDKSYDIQGVAPHNHVVHLTAADFVRLADGKAVTVESGAASAADPHFHLVSIRPRKA